MNGPEKKVFILAVFLFLLGVLVKVSPWDPIPQIETFSYAEQVQEVSPEMRSAHSPAWEQEQQQEQFKGKKQKLKAKEKPNVHFPLAINKASVAELCAIKGVGPKLAEKIVEFRSAHGPFSGPADLKKVSGIGKKKAESILTFVIFD